MRKTFKYRAKINKTAEENANQWLELCRKLYNISLEEKIDVYEEERITMSYYDQAKWLPKLKEYFPEYKWVSHATLCDVLQRVDRAYKAFFRRVKNGDRPGFPRFKSKNRYDSFTLKEQKGWNLNDKYLTIRNIGVFKLFFSRPIEGSIKTVTIRKTSSGKWFVSFSCDNVPIRELPNTSVEVGIDVGIKHFLVDSDGIAVKNPKYFRQSEKLLRRKQRALSRKKKGSNRRNKARVLVCKTYEKITNQRRDFLHKVANYYIANYIKICIEDLNINGMMKNKHLSKSISDSSWGIFFSFLIYKAAAGAPSREVIKVPPQNTSQICSNCGEKVFKSLAVRVHDCPYCGLKIDRDLNASINILRLGQSHRASTSALVGVARKSPNSFGGMSIQLSLRGEDNYRSLTI